MNVTGKNSFPIGNYHTDFINWSKETSGKAVLTCAPKNSSELVAVINWAKMNKCRVRPLGNQHNWSRLTIDNGDKNEDVVFVDMAKHLNSLTITKQGDHGYVTAQTGIKMEALATALEKKKLGFYAMPAPGDLSLGGVLAIGGHGTCIPALNEALTDGGSWGSVSNSITELKAIVWDENSQLYVIKEFKRENAETSAFLVHVGRAFILEVTLQVPRNKRLRCQSFMNITTQELFSKDESTPRNFSYYLNKAGRAEIIWFPFTTKPWLKVWTNSPTYNTISKPVHSPFNYPFSDTIPVQISDLVKKIANGFPELTPTLGATMLTLVNTGLGATISGDLWGWSKDLLMYVKPDTLRVTANGYAIITRRSNIQQVLNEFMIRYEMMVNEYKAVNSYPMNGPIEVRVTGLDFPTDTNVPGALPPALSAARPVDSHPEWDVAIWLDILTLPDTPDSLKFYSEMEEWIFSHYAGDYAMARVEWSKGWGYTSSGAWENEKVLKERIPDSFTAGLNKDSGWEFAVKTLEKYDPHHIYFSPLIDKVFSS